MGILKLNQFCEINEGILSSITAGLSKILGGKKNQIRELLNKIKNAKMEKITETIEIEKEIYKYSKSDSSEYKFNIQNLNKQLRTIISLKQREIESYMEELNRLTKDNEKLKAMAASELSKIEVEVTQQLINKIRPYKEETYLDKLKNEFDQLVKDELEKRKEYEKKIISDDPLIIPQEIEEETISFVDMNNKESYVFLLNLSEKELEDIHKSLINWKFALEKEADFQNYEIEKEIKKAKKSGNSWEVSELEADFHRKKYITKKPIDKIKSKIQLVEKEIKNRRYGNY
jgi:hypothetical protein